MHVQTYANIAEFFCAFGAFPIDNRDKLGGTGTYFAVNNLRKASVASSLVDIGALPIDHNDKLRGIGTYFVVNTLREASIASSLVDEKSETGNRIILYCLLRDHGRTCAEWKRVTCNANQERVHKSSSATYCLPA